MQPGFTVTLEYSGSEVSPAEKRMLIMPWAASSSGEASVMFCTLLGKIASLIGTEVPVTVLNPSTPETTMADG